MNEVAEKLRECPFCGETWTTVCKTDYRDTSAYDAADLLARLKPVLEENERLKRLIWEMDEHVDGCCGCLGHIDQEFRDRINAASLSPSIRSNPDGE